LRTREGRKFLPAPAPTSSILLSRLSAQRNESCCRKQAQWSNQPQEDAGDTVLFHRARTQRLLTFENFSATNLKRLSRHDLHEGLMSDPIPIFRHSASNPLRYYYDDKYKNEHDWSNGIIAFYAFSKEDPPSGTIPIWMHESKEGPYHYYYSTDESGASGGSGWGPGNEWFYVYPEYSRETVAIYQHYMQFEGYTYFYYDTQAASVGLYGPGKVVFYAYPPSPAAFTDDILRVLSDDPGCEGITYLHTWGNKFTRLDTPGLWGKGPSVPEGQAVPEGVTPYSKKLLDAITAVIGSAENSLDMTFLFNTDPFQGGFPDGKFLDAISDGFKILGDKNRSPGIRILLGAIAPKVWPGNLESRMILWLQGAIKTCKSPIWLACNSPKLNTWNHSKIIVADDKQVITGGHNFWQADYLGRFPVHDVSGLFEGPAARGARAFCDKLWEKVTIPAVYFKDGKVVQGRPKLPKISPNEISPAGSLQMLSLGRLGRGLTKLSVSSNASVTARVVALCKAKNCIRISQQSILGMFSTTGNYDLYTCLAIVEAVRAGVDVQIVLSNELSNYGGSASKVLAYLQWLYLYCVVSAPGKTWKRDVFNQCKNAPPRDQIDAWAKLSASPASTSLQLGRLAPDPLKFPQLAAFNNKLKLATLYYAKDYNQWRVNPGKSPEKWKDAGNHSKVYIIDEHCFYVGSDNFYVSAHNEGLQEFGYLIEDEAETKKFMNEYWDELWKYSEKHALT
jgi:phosphatidylserine/phosphatidylglycerophosphate/cardiolipin synthase-like enzyme